MNYAVYNIALDIHKTGTQVALSMIRGENKRKIVISLMENGRPYKISEGCKAVFTATKPDGNFIYNDCEIDYENNLIIYNVTSQTTAAMGEVKCQIELIGGDGGLLFSPTFSLVVANKLYNQEPILASSEEFNALTTYVAELQQKLANGEFKGDKGDKGDKGESGVYVGSGDMPDEYNIQIDPGGVVKPEDFAISVDNKYNPNSTNAQSGIAVAEAVTKATSEAVSESNIYTDQSILNLKLLEKMQELSQSVLLAAHPIGSYYWSSVSTAPSELFGGTWEQVQGKFILAAGTYSDKNGEQHTFEVGENNGEYSHTLTEEQMPSHYHYVISSADSARLVLNQSGEGLASYAYADSRGNGWYSSWMTDTRGNGQPHNNMPPYEVAYCWKRIA